MKTFITNKYTTWLPLVMSAAAVVVVITQIMIFGIPQGGNEGTAAHLFQILIGLQIPVMAFFAFTELSKNPKQVIKILAIQILAMLTALAPVFYFRL